MKQICAAVVLALALSGCSNSTPAPTPTPTNTTTTSTATFTASLLPANEAPNPITGAESVSSGNVTIAVQLTKDSSGTITSAVGTATVNVVSLPTGSSVTLAHIHTGAAGVAGGVLVNFLPPSTIVIGATGAASFNQTTNITGDQATSIVNNPAGFYFNVHTAANSGGVMRGQLTRTQ